ncbi:MAG: cardiolipin synthase [Caldibacillus debilis]|uniref:Cardiolipin synthase n=1 Tax=Caldibacillus debilis TaxID=301148 RepID=A0A3E0K3U7_9BACI|nr:cardiolipin synthase [Caldibacillus debilis]MBO2480944.1 cardiolipin synthase [Bacillaceae bacterium]OUM88269.1 MAG: cardiolipin synthase [Caldibacillus debilis]REJ24405.1 MAG: cardiolipin synthase [Caldibacillus debilis]REJ28139.1 MAG: cardiolipin synthase [Caldibacillus debilis]
MDILTVFISIIFVLNFLMAIAVVFLERRDPSATWAWLLVLFFIPLVGFILYLFIGQNLRGKRLFVWDDINKLDFKNMIREQLKQLEEGTFVINNPSALEHRDLIHLFLKNNNALLTQDNQVDIFIDGKDKFEALFADIKQAKDHIHLQYYIFRDDEIGKKLIDLLTEKAKEGVKVRVLYDEMGSRRIKKRSFNKLIEAGGEVEVFFRSIIPMINLRINFRNHRKLVVIDGKIAYLGGFNVGDEYLGLSKKFGYWRDTHLRIVGNAVHAAQIRFILDWNQASYRHDIHYAANYFPEFRHDGHIPLQIVTSGPDSEWEQIKNGYIKMISSAKKSVFIQTPYFIPDSSILDVLRIASLSGVDVRVMIPNKPDHMFVYWATYSYIGELLKAGAKVYIYENGFIHAKTIVVDENAASVGTANIDVRSFRLNFEVNAFMYDGKIARQLADIFRKDMEKCRRLTYYQYLQRPLKIRFKESISRLLSPIL